MMRVGNNLFTTSRPLLLFFLLHASGVFAQTLAVIGDYGRASYPRVGHVATLVNSWKPDAILTTGDNNYECGDASTIDENVGKLYHDYIYPYKGRYGAGAATNRFFPSLGNHDWGCEAPGNIDAYLNYFTLPGNGRYYDVVLGSVHVFALDSDPHEPDGVTSNSRQAAWLQNRLAASTAPWKLVYFHHPPYTSSSDGASTLGTAPGLLDAAWMRWPFQAWGATAVLAGHAHVYERLVLDDNFPYFVNGSGGGGLHPFGPPVAGSQVRYNDLYGAMRITASPKSITFQFVALTGSVIDTHTIIQASLSPTTTTLSSSANPATAAIDVTFTATVAGKSPTGFVSFTEGRTAIGGCAAVALSGTGDSRTAACTTSALLIGTHGIVADYKGNIANAASFSTPLSQVITDPPQ